MVSGQVAYFNILLYIVLLESQTKCQCGVVTQITIMYIEICVNADKTISSLKHTDGQCAAIGFELICSVFLQGQIVTLYFGFDGGR